jgi:hypothetical protein
MELLIVLGLCFGAYELLGVFQGCFQYNEHPLPYQPHHHLNNGESKDENDENSEGKQEFENEAENENSEEQNLDSLKSGPCSCYSTADDVFDDDTRTILRNHKKPIKRFVFDKPISKFTVSTSLMSLNRDESNLFNYIDDINNNKFHKFRGEDDDEIAETAFDRISSTKSSNDNRNNNKKRRNSSDLALYRRHNEHSENSSSVNVDINKKIFFISAAT